MKRIHVNAELLDFWTHSIDVYWDKALPKTAFSRFKNGLKLWSRPLTVTALNRCSCAGCKDESPLDPKQWMGHCRHTPNARVNIQLRYDGEIPDALLAAESVDTEEKPISTSAVISSTPLTCINRVAQENLPIYRRRLAALYLVAERSVLADSRLLEERFAQAGPALWQCVIIRESGGGDVSDTSAVSRLPTREAPGVYGVGLASLEAGIGCALHAAMRQVLHQCLSSALELAKVEGDLRGTNTPPISGKGSTKALLLRHRKEAGDMYLFCGQPLAAMTLYTEALELARVTNDGWRWACILEAQASALYLYAMVFVYLRSLGTSATSSAATPAVVQGGHDGGTAGGVALVPRAVGGGRSAVPSGGSASEVSPRSLLPIEIEQMVREPQRRWALSFPGALFSAPPSGTASSLSPTLGVTMEGGPAGGPTEFALPRTWNVLQVHREWSPTETGVSPTDGVTVQLLALCYCRLRDAVSLFQKAGQLGVLQVIETSLRVARFIAACGGSPVACFAALADAAALHQHLVQHEERLRLLAACAHLAGAAGASRRCAFYLFQSGLTMTSDALWAAAFLRPALWLYGVARLSGRPPPKISDHIAALREAAGKKERQSLDGHPQRAIFPSLIWDRDKTPRSRWARLQAEVLRAFLTALLQLPIDEDCSAAALAALALLFGFHTQLTMKTQSSLKRCIGILAESSAASVPLPTSVTFGYEAASPDYGEKTYFLDMEDKFLGLPVSPVPQLLEMRVCGASFCRAVARPGTGADETSTGPARDVFLFSPWQARAAPRSGTTLLPWLWPSGEPQRLHLIFRNPLAVFVELFFLRLLVTAELQSESASPFVIALEPHDSSTQRVILPPHSQHHRHEIAVAVPYTIQPGTHLRCAGLSFSVFHPRLTCTQWSLKSAVPFVPDVKSADGGRASDVVTTFLLSAIANDGAWFSVRVVDPLPRLQHRLLLSPLSDGTSLCNGWALQDTVLEGKSEQSAIDHIATPISARTASINAPRLLYIALTHAPQNNINEQHLSIRWLDVQLFQAPGVSCERWTDAHDERTAVFPAVVGDQRLFQFSTSTNGQCPLQMSSTSTRAARCTFAKVVDHQPHHQQCTWSSDGFETAPPLLSPGETCWVPLLLNVGIAAAAARAPLDFAEVIRDCYVCVTYGVQGKSAGSLQTCRRLPIPLRVRPTETDIRESRCNMPWVVMNLASLRVIPFQPFDGKGLCAAMHRSHLFSALLLQALRCASTIAYSTVMTSTPCWMMVDVTNVTEQKVVECFCISSPSDKSSLPPASPLPPLRLNPNSAPTSRWCLPLRCTPDALLPAVSQLLSELRCRDAVTAEEGSLGFSLSAAKAPKPSIPLPWALTQASLNWKGMQSQFSSAPANQVKFQLFFDMPTEENDASSLNKVGAALQKCPLQVSGPPHEVNVMKPFTLHVEVEACANQDCTYTTTPVLVGCFIYPSSGVAVENVAKPAPPISLPFTARRGLSIHDTPHGLIWSGSLECLSPKSTAMRLSVTFIPLVAQQLYHFYVGCLVAPEGLVSIDSNGPQQSTPRPSPETTVVWCGTPATLLSIAAV